MQNDKNRLRSAILIYFLVSLLSLYLSSHWNIVYALTMTNTTYKVIQGALESVAGISSNAGANRKLDISIGELGGGLYKGTNYTLRSGFEYVHSLEHFSFSISQTKIDFGILSPTNLTTRTSILTVNNNSANGFIVSAQENHQLASQGSLIPNTTCDNGLCTDTVSDIWKNSLAFGFGYSCQVIRKANCGNGLGSLDHFKQFTNASISPNAQTIMSGSMGTNQQVNITYQINVPGSQSPGVYTNTIQYIAIPTF